MRFRRMLRTTLIVALACLAGAGARVASAAPSKARAGLATPSEDAWGDEWSDEEARRLGEETERKLLEEAARRMGANVASPDETAPRAGADSALPAEALPTPGVETGASGPRPAAPGNDDASSRALAPPAIDFGELQVRWAQRRKALARGDAVEVAAQEARLLDAMRILDVAELDAFAAAAARESDRLAWSDPKLALARADLAVQLAPSLPASHLARAQARFADDAWSPGAWGGALMDAAAATLSHERTLRPVVADAGVAAAFALFATGAFCTLWFALRSSRLLLHDFHHLLSKRATRVQSALLAALVLALPLVLGLGPVTFAAILVAAIWSYLGRSERIVIGVWLALVGLAPAGAAWLAERTSWGGTRASAYDRIDRGGDLAPLPELEAAAHRKDARPEELFVLARAKKRLGRWSEAAPLLERAIALRPGWAEAEVALGNVRFLEGELDRAKVHYDRAIASNPNLAAAWFDLSRLHYRKVDFASGQTAREKAVGLDRSLVARYGPGEEASGGNWFLADARLSRKDLAALASRDAEGERIFTQASAVLVPWAPARLGIWLPAAFALVLAGASTQRRKLRPAASCVRCGRPVCSRCDPESKGGQECGQCVHVYRRSGVVDPAGRARKEAEVRRFKGRREALRRAAAVALAGPLVSGKVGRGVALLAVCFFLGALVALGDGTIRPASGGLSPEAKAWLFGVPLGAIYLAGLRAGLKAES